MKPKSNIIGLVGVALFGAVSAVASQIWNDLQLKGAVKEEVERQLSEKNSEDEEET
jgi:hypothetical protein